MYIICNLVIKVKNNLADIQKQVAIHIVLFLSAYMNSFNSATLVTAKNTW